MRIIDLVPTDQPPEPKIPELLMEKDYRAAAKAILRAGPMRFQDFHAAAVERGLIPPDTPPESSRRGLLRLAHKGELVKDAEQRGVFGLPADAPDIALDDRHVAPLTATYIDAVWMEIADEFERLGDQTNVKFYIENGQAYIDSDYGQKRPVALEFPKGLDQAEFAACINEILDEVCFELNRPRQPAVAGERDAPAVSEDADETKWKAAGRAGGGLKWKTAGKAFNMKDDPDQYVFLRWPEIDGEKVPGVHVRSYHSKQAGGDAVRVALTMPGYQHDFLPYNVHGYPSAGPMDPGGAGPEIVARRKAMQRAEKYLRDQGILTEWTAADEQLLLNSDFFEDMLGKRDPDRGLLRKDGDGNKDKDNGDEDDGDGLHDPDPEKGGDDPNLLLGGDFAGLCESKCFRSLHALKRYSARDIADLMFLYCIILLMFKNDVRFYEAAGHYARKTLSLGNFQGFRSSATDLYIMVAVLRDKSHLRCKLKNNGLPARRSEKDLFKNMRFSLEKFKMFLRAMVHEKCSRADFRRDETYLFQLQRMLQIQDARYKRWRRIVGNWRPMTHRQRMEVATKVLQEIRRRFPTAELRLSLIEFVKCKSFIGFDDQGKPQSRFKRVMKSLLVPIALGAIAYAFVRRVCKGGRK